MVIPPARLTGVVEWMDQAEVDPTDLAWTLRDLAWINRSFGGTRTVVRHLLPLLKGLAPPILILDVGTGYADIPRAIIRWARHRGISVHLEALDHHPGVRLEAARACARYPEIRIREGNALALPYPDQSVDVVVASLILHHMEGEAPARFLRETRRVARHGIVVSDLRRGICPFLATWVALHVVSRNPLIRHDGPMSIRRGFQPSELLALARAAGWKAPRLYRHACFRLALVEGIR
jgi:SAM-dependent methyltransferase